MEKQAGGKRVKETDAKLESKMKKLSLIDENISEEDYEPQQNSPQVGVARQKVDQEGNSLKIEKIEKQKGGKKQKSPDYEDSRHVVGFEKSLK